MRGWYNRRHSNGWRQRCQTLCAAVHFGLESVCQLGTGTRLSLRGLCIFGLRGERQNASPPALSIMKTDDTYFGSSFPHQGSSWMSLCFLVVASLYASACDPGISSSGVEQRQSGRDGNRPPVVKLVEIVQESIRLDMPVTVRVETEDPERDPLTVRFRWLVNEVVVPNQSEATFHPDQLKPEETRSR